MSGATVSCRIRLWGTARVRKIFKVARALDTAWKNLCKTDMMRTSFRHVGLSLNIDGSEYHLMKFQGQPQGRPSL